MKLVIILITVACLQVSASALAQKKVTLNEKEAPLEKVFNDIKVQTGCNFFYEHNILNGTSKVTINVKDATLQETLDQCLKDQPLIYTIAGNTVGVKKKEAQSVQLQNQIPKDITGQVTDKQGIPLVSATVMNQRTKIGTLTDVKGSFKIRDVLPNDILIFSYIGYKAISVEVGDQNVINIVLDETTNSLDQVVVQAYGQTTKRLATGDIATVKAAEIERQPVMNPLAALLGKVPGLIINETSGFASAPFKVEIRGRAQIDPNRPSEPLFVIDGVPLTVLESGKGGSYSQGSTGVTQNGFSGPAGGQSPFYSINPNDIESISVLKDADATAIYGSRGANGVILITTKTGVAGKTKFDADYSQGISRVTNFYDMLNTQQYLSVRKEAFKNQGITPDIGSAYDLLKWDQNRYTNWQKVLWGGTGENANAQISLSGGDKQTTFRISGDYVRQTSIQTVSGASQRSSVQFNLTHKSLDQRLVISFTSAYSYSLIDYANVPDAVTLPPNAPAIYNADGSLNWSGWAPANNPFSALLIKYKANTGFLNSHLILQYTIFKGLSFSAAFGYSTSHNSQTQQEPITSQNPASNPTGSSEFGNNNNSNAIFEPQFEYKKAIGKGILTALAGASIQSVTQDGNLIEGDGYTNDNLLGSISNAPSKGASDNIGQYKYAALYGRLNYNWEDKYIVNLSARRDGSSRFGPGKQFGNFGAIGGAWIISEEKWLKDRISFLSFAKLRGSYGITGSDGIGDYGYLTAWSGSTIGTYQDGVPVYKPSRFANPNLQWQKNDKLEGALNLGFFKDLLELEVAWYRDICGNQLVTTPLPYITGFNVVTANFPATVQNTGLESTISAKLIDNKDLQWAINFDIGANRNKLLAFPNIAQTSYTYLYEVGQPLNIVRLLKYTGVDPQTGQYTFQDKNHDGQIVNDITNKANDFYNYDLNTKADGGFGTDLTYKNWQINLYFHFQKAEAFSFLHSIGTVGVIQNYPTQVLNHWQNPGDQAPFGRYIYYQEPSDYNYGQSNANLSDASYIRLQNLSLSYNLPKGLLSKIGVRDSKIYVRGQNLFILTKFNGIDPEVPGFGGIPPEKTFIFGLQLDL